MLAITLASLQSEILSLINDSEVCLMCQLYIHTSFSCLLLCTFSVMLIYCISFILKIRKRLKSWKLFKQNFFLPWLCCVGDCFPVLGHCVGPLGREG